MSKLRILVVEDDAVVSMGLKSTLLDLGYEALSVEVTGEKAVEKALGERPDLVLMDIRLAGKMDGIEAAEKIRAVSDVPIIFLTAYGDEETLHRAKKTGPNGYIIKPFEPMELQATIETALYKYELERELRAAKSKAEESEAFVKNILESIDEGLIVIDSGFRIIASNRAYCSQYNISCEEILGRHCYEISHHINIPCYEAGEKCAPKKTFETGQPCEFLHVHHIETGEPIYVETKSYPLKDKHGNIVAVIEILNNVTEKMKLEEQLRQSQKMEAIGLLAGGVAHDFNNILTAIIGYGHLVLMKMEKDGPLRQNVEHMLEGADRAAHLTNDLLLFSRKQISERKPVDTNEIIKRMGKFLLRIIGEDISCKTILHEGGMPVLADAHQLEQVLMNLATNARDAMPQGGVYGSD